MRYVTFIAGPWGAPGIMARVLSVFLPAANPDFEGAYQAVTSWWLEINDTGQVVREIGFDAEQRPIAIAPFRDNFGIFTDSEGHPEPLGAEHDDVAFEKAWAQVESQFLAGGPERSAQG